MKAIVYICVFSAVAALCIGCGGSGGSAPTITGPTAKLRVLNDFVDVSRASANISGTPVLTNQPFGFTSVFTKVKAGAQTINYFDATSHTLLVTRTVSLGDQAFYDAVGLGTSGKGRHILFFTAAQPTIVGQSQVRIANGDEDAAAVDVYFTPLGTKNVTGLTPQLTNVQFADDTAAYSVYTPGSYTIWFTPLGQQSTLLGGADEMFAANTNVTLLLLKTATGLNVQVLTDSGS